MHLFGEHKTPGLLNPSVKAFPVKGSGPPTLSAKSHTDRCCFGLGNRTQWYIIVGELLKVMEAAGQRPDQSTNFYKAPILS